MRRKIYEQLLQWKEHEQDHVHFKNGSALNKDGNMETWQILPKNLVTKRPEMEHMMKI